MNPEWLALLGNERAMGNIASIAGSLRGVTGALLGRPVQPQQRALLAPQPQQPQPQYQPPRPQPAGLFTPGENTLLFVGVGVLALVLIMGGKGK